MNRVLMKRPAILSACAAMGLSVGALAADVTIADLAPSDSIVVISIDNYEQMRASFDRTGFKAIWTDPGMQKWFHRQAAEFFADFEETLDGMGLEKEELKSPHGMAGGAMWMVLNDENVLEPRLLILDEPTEGIQPNVVREIGRVIRRLNQEQIDRTREQAAIVQEINLAVRRLNRELGMTVLLVEQKLPFARWVAQQFCIVDKGRAVATGAIADLNDDLVRQYLTV